MSFQVTTGKTVTVGSVQLKCSNEQMISTSNHSSTSTCGLRKRFGSYLVICMQTNRAHIL